MEIDLLRAQLRESEDAIMARFLHGLNKEIYDVLERDREKENVRSDRSPTKGSEPFQDRKETIVTPSPSTPRTSNIKGFKLQWLSEHEELVVNKQVEVAFTLGRYEDKVLYDVVPMEAKHLLLGWPRQFDRKVNHD
ncbi:hypothetical protein CR513_19413, partial [Mucuna pruriens]